MGSVIGMTDASGAVVATYAYDPWGNPISATGTAAIATRNPLRYRAYYADAETGLCYMPARYYDPATYRFLSVDPAAPTAGDPASLSGFLYCVDDPVNLSDTDGREPHGYNMCDGYGDDGYNYGHDDYHSTVDQQGNVTPSKNSQGMAASAAASRGMAEARVEASLAMKVAQRERILAARKSMQFMEPDAFEQSAAEFGAQAETMAILFGAVALASTPETAGVGTVVAGACAAAFSVADNLVDTVVLVYELVEWSAGRSSGGDLALAICDWAAGPMPVGLITRCVEQGAAARVQY